MKTLLIQMLFLSSFMLVSSTMDAGPRTSPTTVLHQEISSLFKDRNLSFLANEAELVTVDFLINAKNEIVVLHTEGNSTAACNYVKELLNFKKVKFRQAKQLTPYTVNIRLIK
ncbi:MAG: hypothetical protein KBA14_06515 [Saprospiraceae bacterium]|nr:hypothetical protein [Saprospiraceae bacterium]